MDNITQDQQIDIKFTHEEIKKAKRNTKTRTAPGFSGDTINLYRLINAIAPNTNWKCNFPMNRYNVIIIF